MENSTVLMIFLGLMLLALMVFTRFAERFVAVARGVTYAARFLAQEFAVRQNPHTPPSRGKFDEADPFEGLETLPPQVSHEDLTGDLPRRAVQKPVKKEQKPTQKSGNAPLHPGVPPYGGASSRSVSSEPTTDSPEDIPLTPSQRLAELLHSSATVKSAILLSEILHRPEDRWE